MYYTEVHEIRFDIDRSIQAIPYNRDNEIKIYAICSSIRYLSSMELFDNLEVTLCSSSCNQMLSFHDP